jgi:hypothetical protein
VTKKSFLGPPQPKNPGYGSEFDIRNYFLILFQTLKIFVFDFKPIKTL